MAVEPTWWEMTFGSEVSTPDQLQERIRRLEVELRAEQQRSSDSRKRSTAIIARIERAKDAMEMVLTSIVSTVTIVAGMAIYERYSGWDFVLAWVSFGALATILYRYAYQKIAAI